MIVPRMLRWLKNHVSKPNLRMLLSFLYVSTYTVGTKQTFVLAYRFVMELRKDVKLQMKKLHAKR